MTTREFVKLEKHLLPSFPDFSIKGAMLFIPRIEHVLRGFHFEPSGFNRKRFYVNMFFMPLCVPAEHVHFTFGHRVGHVWDIDQANLEATLEAKMQKDVPFLLRLRAPREVAKALEPLTKGNRVTGYANLHCYEAFAYSLIQAEETPKALSVIDDLLRRANREVAWEAEIALRAHLVKEKLLKGAPKASEQLLAWERETRQNLGFTDL